jgi:copper chaperone NosL
MKPVAGVAWLVGAGFVAGCGPVDINRPPTVRFGEDACASCRMIISDDRFAAALVTTAGDTLKFDDIGCLVQHEAGRVRPDATCWVRSFQGQEWLKAPDAAFFHAPGISSPMGYGLAALSDGRTAEGLATRQGARSFRFGELPGFLAELAGETPTESPRSD